ncbi:MAG: hypothetical protein K1X53_08855 [Candidatus Sumerlaeaceae bacterium]|nr:hypothetical protein [Candidatus Sumerlaeaceae bacterium]
MFPERLEIGEMEIWLKLGSCLVLAVGFGLVFMLVTRKRGMGLIQEWARLNQFTILSIRQPFFVPFWRAGRGYHLFRVAVQDRAGVERHCWIRCKELSLGPDSVEVTWDEAPLP